MYSVLAYLMSNRKDGHTPIIICKSGLTLSVQASFFHYCSPRNDVGPYTEVEVGYPNRECETLLPYRDGGGPATECIYPYVPVEIVNDLILDNGGPDYEAMGMAKAGN